MKTSSPCTFVRFFLVATASATWALGASRMASLAEPTSDSAVAVAQLAEGKGAVVASRWTPQAAPGSMAVPAADARSEWLVLQGWTKVPIAGDTAAGAESPELPDPWPRGRKYERAWYVLRADLGREMPESLWLRFDAVAHQCEVFVNGQPAGHHLGGFTPFAFDLTRVAHAGINTIAVFVRDEHAVETTTPPRAVSQLGVTRSGAFNSVAGILGGVWLEKRRAVHLDHVLVQTSTRRNEIRVSTWVRGATAADAIISHAVFAWPNGAAPVLELPAGRAPAVGSPAVVKMPWAEAKRWSPEHPNLYTLRTTVRAGGRSETVETRFGFREFWTEGRSFVLNGTPVRLLGASVASDLRTAEMPDAGRRYARDVLEFLRREFNYRAMRLHASIHPRYAVEAADEVGTLLIDQSGIWSAMASYYDRGGDEFLKNTEQQFTEWFWRDANNPSVVIWDVENEMIRDQRTPERERWVLALDRFIKQHDPSRIVEHAGAAWYSPEQEDIHLHMQEQYSQVLRTWARDSRVPLVIGEFWVGGRGGETRLPNAYEFADRLDWLQEESRQYREKILEMRNFGASAVMPFWLDRLSLGRTEGGVRHHYDAKTDRIYRWPVPGFVNLGGEALAPVIVFAWPRGGSVAAGGTLEREIVVCNDREQPVTLAVSCGFAGQRQQWQATVAPGAQDRHRVAFAGAGSGKLVVTVSDADGRSLPGDTLDIHAVPAERLQAPTLTRRLVLVAVAGDAAQAFTALGLPCEVRATLPEDAKGTLVVVPPNAAADALGRSGAAIRRYLSAGGRLLVLNQSDAPAWLPLSLPFWSAAKKSAPEFTMLGWPTVTRHLIFSREVALESPGHPAFAGLTAEDLAWWNPQDGRVADDAFARPGALDIRAGAPYRVLAGSARRENASMVEGAFGAGTALFCQLQVLENQAHPAARALLFNLLRYLDGPAWQATERGVGLAGDLPAARVSALTGLPAGSLAPVQSAADAPRVVLAGDKADPALLDALARTGHVVVVLSRDTAARLPGYAVKSVDRLLSGTRGRTSDESLFWGIGTGSFLPLDQSPAKAVLARYPKSAHVVLGGLSSAARFGRKVANAAVAERVEVMDGEAPLAVAESRGTGLLVVTTIEPWNPRSEAQRQLLTTLLANAGVALPVEGERPAVVVVKHTVPLRLDGKLDDWTNDMEDRNVSAFQHATPVVLSGRDTVSGAPQSDASLSGVVYLLHDAVRLYVGGIVFSNGAPRVDFEFGGRRVGVELGRGTVTVDGAPVPGAQVATGRQAAREVSDTRLLALTSFNAQIASMAAASDTPGRTFELALPLTAVGLAPGQEVRARIALSNATGAALRVPMANAAEEEPGLLLRLENR